MSIIPDLKDEIGKYSEDMFWKKGIEKLQETLDEEVENRMFPD